jgi:hypothetical protein
VNYIVSVVQQKVIIPNKYGEKLVGILHETGSLEIVILCHGAQCTKVSVSNMLSVFFSVAVPPSSLIKYSHS